MGVFVFSWLILSAAPALAADDPLARARLLYNQRQFDEAVSAAEQARQLPAHADLADLVAARAYLERFRESAATDDLANARDRLRRLDPARFPPRERAEYIVGLGEALFFDDSYGAAAAVFDSVLLSGESMASEARERVLDWWATSVDREAKPRPEIERQSVYQRIRTRMRRRKSRRVPRTGPRRLLAGGGRPGAGRSTGRVGCRAGRLGPCAAHRRPRRCAPRRSRSTGR